MTGLTSAEEQALRDAEQAVRDLGPRFAEVMRQATDALRPYAWAEGALIVSNQDEAERALTGGSGAGHLLDMLDTMTNLIADVRDVLREPWAAMVEWRAEGRR